MPRLVIKLHGRPRTRRERLLLRLRAVRTKADRMWDRLGHDRRSRTTRLRAQEFFAHLGDRLHHEAPEPVAVNRRRRPLSRHDRKRF